jgi:hypothetical protein
MKINSKDFRVRGGDKVNLKKWPTKVDPVYDSKVQYQKLLEEHVAQLSSQQQLLYASNRHAVLLIFQAMDVAFEDGATDSSTFRRENLVMLGARDIDGRRIEHSLQSVADLGRLVRVDQSRRRKCLSFMDRR